MNMHSKSKERAEITSFDVQISTRERGVRLAGALITPIKAFLHYYTNTPQVHIQLSLQHIPHDVPSASDYRHQKAQLLRVRTYSTNADLDSKATAQRGRKEPWERAPQ